MAAREPPWAVIQETIGVHGNSLAASSMPGHRDTGRHCWRLLTPEAHTLELVSWAKASLRPSGSHGQMSGDTESESPAKDSPSREVQREEQGGLGGKLGGGAGLDSGHHPLLQALGQVPVPKDPGHRRWERGGGAGSEGCPECSEGPLPHQVDSGRAHAAPEPQGLVTGRGFLKAVVQLGTEQRE